MDTLLLATAGGEGISVIALTVLLLFLAGVLYLVNTHAAALNGTIKMIINVVLIVVAVILVLSAFGVWQEVKTIRVPQL